jgi:hypothetical protein
LNFFKLGNLFLKYFNPTAATATSAVTALSRSAAASSFLVTVSVAQETRIDTARGTNESNK